MSKFVCHSRVEELLFRLREKLAARGVRGIIGLGRQFRIMDDDNSFSIDFLEFRKTMTDYRLGFTDSEIEAVFREFDVNRDGKIIYDEFLRIIRGKLNDNRKQWVHRAFRILDIDESGEITVSDIERRYNAKMHPDVKSGKRTEEEILAEFLETFETHHNILMGKKPDGKVTLEEFEEYYSNVSASIDTDEYFEVMMKNAWKLDEAAKVYDKGWKNEEDFKAPSKAQPAGLGRSPYKKGQGNASSIDNPLNLFSEMGSIKKPQIKKSSALESFRRVLATRGAKGIIGLARQFRIMDNDGSKHICMSEFVQAIKDYRIPIDDKDIRGLFEVFDRDRNGNIDYEEFLRGVKGEMNQFRQNLVTMAFNKFDKDGSGIIDKRDLEGVYNAKHHPDVKSGKKTEDQVFGEFLETFEMHKNLYGGRNDQKVTREEFAEYYTWVSASIDDDRYFETMMNNAWKFKGDEQKKTAWTESYSKPKPSAAPFGTTDEPTNYSTSSKPQKQYQKEEYKHRDIKEQDSPQKSPIKSYSDQQLIDEFRKVLFSRGTRGILNLQRTFKIIDDDNSKSLCLSEFKKVIKEYRLKYSEKDAERLFSIFDIDRSGHINYDEFLRSVIVILYYINHREV